MPLTSNQALIYNKCVSELNLASASLSPEYYYDSLPQCIIDAVYSIGVNYTSTRNTVIRYCERTDKQRLSNPLGNQSDVHTVNELLTCLSERADFGAVELFGNEQKTSSRNGKLKAEAVYEFAQTLYAHNINTIADIRVASTTDIARVEKEIKKIKGQTSGISFSYFLMLAGNENHMKIDRWLLRFVGEALNIEKFNDVPQAYEDLIAVCNELKATFPHITPRLLDHTIWSYIRAKEIKENNKKNKN